MNIQKYTARMKISPLYNFNFVAVYQISVRGYYALV